ncbi:MAG: hypothetical protein P4L46_26455 [Fimbriimonas sp.]|nr:hypothetical protein [Fimbriimonas sp.]
MTQLDLSGDWRFAFASDGAQWEFSTGDALEASTLETYPCTVPGNFELDLSANGILDADLFYGLNIAKAREYETSHVWYFRQFDCTNPGGDRAVLVFEGIDCIADIFLNGARVASTDNMLIPHEFDVTGLIQDRNDLLVHIHPVAERAANYPYPPSVTCMPHIVEGSYIRKAPHMFGWDIMPRAVSAGLWRPVSLELRPPERIAWLYLATKDLDVDHSKASLVLRYQLDIPTSEWHGYEVAIEGKCGGSTFSTSGAVLFRSGRLDLNVDHPELWWPLGRGPANLYDIVVRLFKDGREIDVRSFRHGIRSVRLDRTPTTDKEGSGEFCFVINHERVFARGTNWVPADAYHSRDIDRIPAMVGLAVEIGCNMIRCWGGNVYENDLFYDLCDEAGIMVWQDFAMACAAYPQDAEFQTRLAEEARETARRLRQHACLVLWAGDNECDEARIAVGLGLDPNDNVLTRKVLPDVLRDEDPFRPYLPSSPYLSPEVLSIGKPGMPEAHLWGVRHDYRADFYRHTNAHFISEIGFLSCPAESSIRRFIPETDLWPYQNNPVWKLHATSPIPGYNLFDYRVELLAKEAATMFGSPPDNLEDFIFATQAFQAEGMKFIVERFRSQMWRRTGILWWNLIDGWPQFSDAVVDYFFEKKLAFDVIRSSQQPVCMMIREEDDGSLSVVGVNDTRCDVRIEYRVEDVDTNSVIIHNVISLPANATTFGTSAPPVPRPQGALHISWTGPDGAGDNHFLYGEPPYGLDDLKRWYFRLFGSPVRPDEPVIPEIRPTWSP